jgi:hypothetical protein
VRDLRQCIDETFSSKYPRKFTSHYYSHKIIGNVPRKKTHQQCGKDVKFTVHRRRRRRRRRFRSLASVTHSSCQLSAAIVCDRLQSAPLYNGLASQWRGPLSVPARSPACASGRPSVRRTDPGSSILHPATASESAHIPSSRLSVSDLPRRTPPSPSRLSRARTSGHIGGRRI